MNPTNLTDEGLRGVTRELCLKMEHEHDSIFFNQSDFNYILHALKQIRDAAKKEMKEKAAVLANNFECGEEGYSHSCCSTHKQVATAIRQMDGGN